MKFRSLICFDANFSAMTDIIRGVLFDLDGTMVDNMKYHIDAWIEMGRRFGRELSREYIQREFSGRKNEELFPLVVGRPLPAAEIERLAEEKEARYRELFAPHVRLLDGLDAFIERLAEAGVVMGIATAAPAKNRDFVLERLGLGARIATVVGAEQVERGKPAPDLFLEGARRMGCEPGVTLVFEDAVLGVQAARAADMVVCGVTTGESTEALLAAGAHFAIRDFSEVPEPLPRMALC